MQFITTGNRIAVENFTIGDLYTITFTNGNYINSACIGIGANFVTFQRNEPELLFSLTMETAELVSTIDLYAGGSGTNNYNELQNKPSINSVELVGNKSLESLGIQPEITAESPLSSALVSGLGSAAAADTTDFATAAQGELAATAVQPSDLTTALATKQDALTTAQLDAVNSGITSTDAAQIETNKNNILLKANADNTAYKTAAASFSGTNMQCVFDSAMFTADNRRGSVLMMFGSQKSSVNNTLLMIDFNDAGIRSIRRLTDGASEVITAIGAISSNKQSFAFTADGNSYTYPCLISMFANKDIKPNFTIVAQT